MFFFFQGGITPRIQQTIKKSFDKCFVPNCRGGRIDLVEVKQTLSVFFIPVWAFGSPQQMIYCNTCENFFDVEMYKDWKRERNNNGRSNVIMVNCNACGHHVERDWKFCPNCGSKMN